MCQICDCSPCLWGCPNHPDLDPDNEKQKEEREPTLEEFLKSIKRGKSNDRKSVHK